MFKYIKHTYDGDTPTKDIIAKANNPALPEGILHTLFVEFEKINKEIERDKILLIPILPTFARKHDESLFVEIRDEPVKPKVKKKPRPAPKPKSTEVEAPPKKKKAKKAPLPEPVKNGLRELGGLKYRTYPYTFSRPGETIEAIIRLYNDMKVSKPIIRKLTGIFSEINPKSLPPKLGQTVDIPVLLPFCYRHENEHKIFNDGK